MNIFNKLMEGCLDNVLRCSSAFRRYVNARYRVRDGWALVDSQYLEGIYYTHNGLKFHLNHWLDSLDEVDTGYEFDDIRSTDTVVDIGACIGGFSLPAAKRAKHVYAIEPLFADYLRDNLKLNGITNVTVIDDFGLGGGKFENIRFGDRCKTIKTASLSDFIESIGGCDFIKMDCEGAEWNIKAHELEGVRRIEGEIHVFNRKHKLNIFKQMIDEAGFKYVTEMQKRHMILHATRENEP